MRPYQPPAATTAATGALAVILTLASAAAAGAAAEETSWERFPIEPGQVITKEQRAQWERELADWQRRDEERCAKVRAQGAANVAVVFVEEPPGQTASTFEGLVMSAIRAACFDVRQSLATSTAELREAARKGDVPAPLLQRLREQTNASFAIVGRGGMVRGPVVPVGNSKEYGETAWSIAATLRLVDLVSSEVVATSEVTRVSAANGSLAALKKADFAWPRGFDEVLIDQLVERWLATAERRAGAVDVVVAGVADAAAAKAIVDGLAKLKLRDVALVEVRDGAARLRVNVGAGAGGSEGVAERIDGKRVAGRVVVVTEVQRGTLTMQLE